MTLTLTIRLSTSARFTLPAAGSSPITPSTTILQVKELIAQHEDSGRVEVARQRLIYKGRILSENDKTLADYGINEATSGETVLYLVKGSGGAPSTSAPAATAPAPTPASTSNNPANPFAMLGQMGSGGGGMPDLQQMQQQLQQNPEFMSQMMNNPMVQSLMSNPDFMSNMMESNPQMQQVLNSNPELRQALRDPELMRRSMEMMRDPSMMQQMMRNQDLAMSQIENMPGGYNALRRMYEDVQVPMMDAMSGSGEGNGDGAQQQSRGTNNSGAQNQAMPNPWGSPSGGSTNTNANNSGAGNAANMFNPFAMPNMGAGAGGAVNPWANPAGVGSTQQLEATIQMLENPLMQQMMDQMMSNPEAVRGMMESNPMMRQMRESNPQVAALMENPEMMRAMMNPQTLRSMLQLQNAFSGLSTGGAGGAQPTGGLDFSNLLGGAAPAPAMPNPFLNFPFAPPQQQPANQSAPGERFRNQLQSLNDMGFTDRSANISALVSAHGNLNRAIEIMLESPPEMDGGAHAGAGSDGVAENAAASSGEQAEESGGEDPKGTSEKKND